MDNSEPNLPQRSLNAFKRFLTDSAGPMALAAGLGPLRKAARDEGDFKVTKKPGKRGYYMRRIIDYKRLGPFYHQIETKYLHGEAWPVMQSYYVHRLLHATKGWREYVGGAAMKLPVHRQLPPYPQRFFGANFRLATNY